MVVESLCLVCVFRFFHSIIHGWSSDVGVDGEKWLLFRCKLELSTNSFFWFYRCALLVYSRSMSYRHFQNAIALPGGFTCIHHFFFLFSNISAPRHWDNLRRVRGEVSGFPGYVRCHVEVDGLYSWAVVSCGKLFWSHYAPHIVYPDN